MKPLSLFLVTSVLVSTTPVRADETASNPVSNEPAVGEARRRFQRGVELYHEGSDAAALAEFNKAYQLAPNYKILFNIAEVQVERHDYVAALRLFQKYLEQGGDAVAPERRDRIEQQIKALRNRVGELSITTNVSGAELVVDGVSAGELRDGLPVLVNAGLRQLQLRKPGYAASVRTVSVAGGERVRLEWELKREAAASSAAPSSPAAAHVASAPRLSVSDESASRLPMWVSLASTGVFAGAAVTLGILTSRSNDDLDRKLEKLPEDRAATADARADLKRNALLTDAFMAAAAVAGGLSVYFMVSGRSSSKPQDAAQRHTLRVSTSGSGVRLSGTF